MNNPVRLMLIYLAFSVTILSGGQAQEETISLGIAPSSVVGISSNDVQASASIDNSQAYHPTAVANLASSTQVLGSAMLTVASSSSSPLVGSEVVATNSFDNNMSTQVLLATDIGDSSTAVFSSSNLIAPSAATASLNHLSTVGIQASVQSVLQTNVSQSYSQIDNSESLVATQLLSNSAISSTQILSATDLISASSTSVYLSTSSVGYNTSTVEDTTTGGGEVVGNGTVGERGGDDGDDDGGLSSSGAAAAAITLTFLLIGVVAAGIVLYRRNQMTPRSLQAMMSGGVRYQTHNSATSYQDEDEEDEHLVLQKLKSGGVKTDYGS